MDASDGRPAEHLHLARHPGLLSVSIGAKGFASPTYLCVAKGFLTVPVHFAVRVCTSPLSNLRINVGELFCEMLRDVLFFDFNSQSD